VEIQIGMDMRLWGPSTGVAQIPVFESLAGLGYEGVEIPLCGQGASEIKLIGVALSDLGLESVASARLPSDANPVAGEAAVRKRAVEYLKARMDDAALLGCTLLTGGLFQAQGVFSGKPPTDQEWEWSRRCLREVGAYAADLGLCLALEFQSRFDAYLINTASDAARMCRDLGLDNVGVLYNTFHAHMEEFNPARGLPSTGDYLMHIHLSESHRGELGRGQVQWQETFATLAFLDYKGWLMVQALGVAEHGAASSDHIWRNNFDSREQLSADAITWIRQLLRLQRQ